MNTSHPSPGHDSPERSYWVGVLKRIAEPVLEAGAAGRLHLTIPVAEHHADRSEFAALEAVGRLLCGIAPWLALKGLHGEEETLRSRFAALARDTLVAGVDPGSPGFLNFSQGQQPIVDAAFLAQAFLRAPDQLWHPLPAATRDQLVEALKCTRTRKPAYCNWLLFSAITETFLFKANAGWDPMRVDYALRTHDTWYLGDGVYGDGPEFHWDYYNSFVIQPMLLEVLDSVGGEDQAWEAMRAPVLSRAQRHAAIQERLISPEGTFPAIGRSLVYRFGAFQLLAQMALRQQLPAELHPAQVRCALGAVIRRMIEAPGTFHDNGWLRIGFCGHQPALAEGYISTGSLYLCAAGLLPLGLPPDALFWTGPDQPWTAAKIWSGQDMPGDHCLGRH